MSQRPRTSKQEHYGHSGPLHRLMEFFGRRRGRKAFRLKVTQELVNKLGETETSLDELQVELRYLREHRQEQEDSISVLKNEIDDLYSIREKSDYDLDFLKESLELEKEENLQLTECEKKDKTEIEKLYKQLKLNQKSLECMTKALQKSEEHVDNLGSELQKYDEKVNHLQGVKEYLAKNIAEKEHEVKQMKELYKKDRDAFEKVHEFNLQKFDELQKKYENVLRHLWEKCHKCRSCRTNIQHANINELSTSEQISLRMLKLRQDDKFSTEGISITKEPNITLLNTTFTQIENELYRYKIMNDLLEDRISEYEPEYSRSSVGSHCSSLSDLSFQEESSNMKINSDDSIGQPTTVNSSLDVDQSVSSLNESKAENSDFGFEELLDGAINGLSTLFDHSVE